jgi:phosphoglycolate phosphatase-like HAD superfamily hydrolase
VDAWFFDFDGVILESVDIKTQAFAKLYEDYGKSVVEKVVAYHLKHGGVSRYEKFRYFHQEILGITLNLQDEERLGLQFNELVEQLICECAWVPGAKELLEINRGRTPMFVISGTPEEELRRIVERRDMKCFFKGVFGSPRHKGELISMVVSEHKLDPQRCIMIGDAITDYDGAQEAGVHFIGRVGKNIRNPFPVNTVIETDLRPLTDRHQ